MRFGGELLPIPRKLKQLLRLIEEYVPVQQIWVDMAEGDESQSQPFESARGARDCWADPGSLQGLYQCGVESSGRPWTRLRSTEAIGERFELVEPTVDALLKETEQLSELETSQNYSPQPADRGDTPP